LIYPALRPSRSASVEASAALSPGLSEAAVSDALSSYFARPEDAGDPYAMPLLARDFAGLPPAVICAAELDVLLPDARDYAAALTQVGVASRLILAEGLPHTFLRALHISAAAARAFEDFARELGRLLRV
jgi:acetyl esterase